MTGIAVSGGSWSGSQCHAYDRGLRLVFVGPSVQLWFGGSIWLGGGLGLGLYAPERIGKAIDFRIGYTFDPNAKHAIDVSLELTPCFYGGPLPSDSATNVTVLFGYAYL